MTNLPIFEIDDSINPIETSKEPTKKPNEQIIQNKAVDAKKSSPNEYTKIGRIIAEEMSIQGHHPVIIFGSSNSGKSTFLASLFSYFQVSITNGIGIYLGDSLIPLNTSHGKPLLQMPNVFFIINNRHFWMAKLTCKLKHYAHFLYRLGLNHQNYLK